MSSEPSGPSPNFITGELDAVMRGRGEPGPEARRRAVLTIAAYATDADDCRLLMDMAGLAVQEGVRDEH